jgi:hypothetical protein
MLMLRQRCFPAKASQVNVGTSIGHDRSRNLPSLARGLLADVRPLARVNSPVAGQTRRLLLQVSIALRFAVAGTYIGKSLVAAFMVADVRLLARMRSRVDGQCTALDEALVAVGHGAMVRTLVGVNAVVATQVRLAVERLFVSLRSVTSVPGWGTAYALTLPHSSHEQLKSRPPPSAMIDLLADAASKRGVRN